MLPYDEGVHFAASLQATLSQNSADQVTHLELCNRNKGEISDPELGKLAKPKISIIMRFIASHKLIKHILRSVFQKHVTAAFLVALSPHKARGVKENSQKLG